MHIVAVVLSIVLALLLAGSGVAKLRGVPAVVDGIVGVGWPRERIWVLAVVELIGAVGLLVGLAVPAIGVAAAIGAVLYFVCAVVSHLRLRQSASGALVPLVVAVVTLVVLVMAL